MARSSVVSFLIVGFFTILLSGTAFANVQCTDTQGRIDLPWGPVAPYSVDGFEQLHGVFVYVITNFQVNNRDARTFSLEPEDVNSGIVCIGNECLLHHPDYNVAFYRVEGTVHTRLATFDGPGPVEGEIPSQTDYALVWMRSGTHQPLLGDLVAAEDRFSWEICTS